MYTVNIMCKQTNQTALMLRFAGVERLINHEYDAAEALFSQAVEMEPDNGAAHRDLGFAILSNTGYRPELRLNLSRGPLEKACVLLPHDAATRYCMATYWRAAKRADRYRNELEAALRADPSHIRAQAELRALKPRAVSPRQPAPSGIPSFGGFLRRISGGS
jgi:tetratricopeptide (TPR) repeat protein